MSESVTAGRAAASLALSVLRGVLAGLAKDGKVSMADIDRTIALLERGTVELDRAYAKAHGDTVENAEKSLLAIAEAEIEEEKEVGGSQNRTGMRSDPIHRLLALPLEKLFFAKPARFERKYLSAYFAAVRALIGPIFVAFDSECKAIIQSMLPVHGKNLNWDIIYAEPRTIALMRRIFGTMTNRFAMEKLDHNWREMMTQAGADGSIPTKAQIEEVKETILAFFRALPPAA